MRADAGRGKSSIQVRASHGLAFGDSFCEKHGKAPNESVTGSGAIDALYGKRCYVLTSIPTGQKRSICTQRDNHPANTTRQKFVGTFLRVFNSSDGNSRDRFRFTFIGHKIVESRERIEVDGLRRCRVHNASDPVFSREGDRVINGLQRNLELEDDAVGSPQRLGSRINVCRPHRVIRSLHHENAVLPVRLDKNGGHAAR